VTVRPRTLNVPLGGNGGAPAPTSSRTSSATIGQLTATGCDTGGSTSPRATASSIAATEGMTSPGSIAV
jgi:hypothetical protein